MKFRQIWYLLVFLVVGVVLLGIVTSPSALAYEEYLTDSGAWNSSNESYGANWTSQSFTTTNHSISLQGFTLPLFGNGSPGNFTVWVRTADVEGRPTGSNLASGTYDGDTLAAGPTGENVTVNMTSVVLLQDNTPYAVGINASGGNGSNMVGWRTVNGSPPYTGGVLSYSDDSGSTWSIDSGQDAGFRVVGEPVIIDIASVQVFTNIFVASDRLFVIEYELDYTVFPSETFAQLWQCYVGEQGRAIEKEGYQLTSVWFNATGYDGWGDTTTVIINSTNLFEVYHGDSYTVLADDYTLSSSMSEGRGQLFAYSMVLLATLEAEWSTNLTFMHEQYGLVPSLAGAQVLESAVPGIGSVIPIIGAMLYWESLDDIDYIDITDFNYTNWSYAASLQDETSPMMWGAFTNISSWLGLGSPNFVVGALTMLIYFMAVGAMYAATRHPVGSIVLAFPVLPFSAMFMGFGLIWVAIPVFVIAIFGAAYYFTKVW